MAGHDANYHLIFSDPRMVAQLLCDFVDEPWSGDLNLDAMERVNGKFHAATGERREGDIVWRIPLRSGGDAYLLLLLEFQSSADPWMALRVLVYAGLLWQHIVKERRLPPDGRLPPVFPLVLYNGEPRWTAPRDLSALIGLPANSPLWQWQPGMRYHVLDEGAYPDAELRRRETLAALLFRLENVRQPADGSVVAYALAGWFRQHPDFETLAGPFAAIAARLVVLEKDARPDGRGVAGLLEIGTMLENRAAEWMRQWKEEGLNAGRLEGRLEGRRAGERDGAAVVLIAQLERRFGSVPDAVKQRIVTAEIADLREWSLRIFDATSIGDILH
jgi:hypothetical protein